MFALPERKNFQSGPERVHMKVEPRSSTPPPPPPPLPPTPAENRDRFSPGEVVPPDLARVLQQSGRPYYDGEKDKAACESYYAQVNAELAEGPREAYLALSHHLWETHTKQLDYDPKRNLYPWVDLRPSLRLQSVYSPLSVATGDPLRGRTEGSKEALEMARLLQQAPLDAVTLAASIALAETRKYYNCEHVVPKVWFDNDKVMAGDLHHLFACQHDVNEERSSRRLVDLPTRTSPDVLGEGWAPPNQELFEPAAGKGEVARAVLYFLLRYPGKIGDQSNEYQVKDLPALLKWHRENPVSLHERHRNQAIFESQGNRNPLIDHPEWADRIDFAQGFAKPRG